MIYRMLFLQAHPQKKTENFLNFTEFIGVTAMATIKNLRFGFA